MIVLMLYGRVRLTLNRTAAVGALLDYPCEKCQGVSYDM